MDVIKQLKYLDTLSSTDNVDELHKKLSDYCKEGGTLNLVDASANREYTCFEFAMYLHESEDYMNLKKELAHAGFSSLFCDSNFILWLLNNDLIENPTNQRQEYLVFYGLGMSGNPRHSGIVVRDDRVLSKWGTGYIFEHNLNEVPKSYGNPRYWSRKYSSEESFKLFCSYLLELNKLLTGLLSDK